MADPSKPDQIPEDGPSSPAPVDDGPSATTTTTSLPHLLEIQGIPASQSVQDTSLSFEWLDLDLAVPPPALDPSNLPYSASRRGSASSTASSTLLPPSIHPIHRPSSPSSLRNSHTSKTSVLPPSLGMAFPTPPRGASLAANTAAAPISQEDSEAEHVPLTTLSDSPRQQPYPDDPLSSPPPPLGVFASSSSADIYASPLMQPSRTSSPAPLVRLNDAPYTQPVRSSSFAEQQAASSSSGMARGPSAGQHYSPSGVNLVPLPTSPYVPYADSPAPSYHSNPFSPPLSPGHSHPARQDSYSHPDAALYPLPPGGTPSPHAYAQQGSTDELNRASYFSDLQAPTPRAYSISPSETDAASTRRLYTGPTSSYYNAPGSPGLPPSPSFPSSPRLGASPYLNGGAGSPAAESSIWGETADGDEKGYYGSLNKGVTSAEAQREAASGRAKGWKSVSGGKRWSRKRWITVLSSAGVLAAIAIVAGIVAYKKIANSDTANDSSLQAGTADGDDADAGESNPKAGDGKKEAPTWGGDGSVVTMDNGTTFTYRNSFGGFWVSSPFNDSAQAQSYTPPLNQEWDYASDRIYGVNLGGWLNLEPFITPALYEPYTSTSTPAVDEYTLSQNLGADLASTLTEHYETFITEKDFADIAAAGLNWVRLPVAYWAIEVWEGEPFLEGVSWGYVLKAIRWARKYGLRINLDLHAVPGSQNGWNHSGRLGTVGFLNGVMGIANAQRTLNYIRVLVEFINQEEYHNVVPMFGVNEVSGFTIGLPVVRQFYMEMYTMIRSITGIGTGKGPVIALHDAFGGPLTTWAGFMEGADRVVLDSHPYLAFTNTNDDPMPEQVSKPCTNWAAMFNTSVSDFGPTFAGEWSVGVNDCGQFLNGVNNGTRFEGEYPPTDTERFGSCDMWTDTSQWSDTFKGQIRDFALAQMESFQNWFFWTWKIGESLQYKRIASPAWSYSNGLAEGYMPPDPRAHQGACIAMASKYDNPPPATSVPLPSTLPSWQTGGSGAGTIAAAQVSSYGQWPPSRIANMPVTGSLTVGSLPTYTPTGPALSLSASPTPTGQPAFTPVLKDGYFTEIPGCDYPNIWSGAGMAQPTAGC